MQGGGCQDQKIIKGTSGVITASSTRWLGDASLAKSLWKPEKFGTLGKDTYPGVSQRPVR